MPRLGLAWHVPEDTSHILIFVSADADTIVLLLVANSHAVHLPHGRTVAGAGVPRCVGTGMGDWCGRAALCAHGRDMPVTRVLDLRQMPHPVPVVCAVLMRGAAVRAPLGSVYARTKRERVGRSGWGHRCCTCRCLSRAGVLGSLTRPAVRGVGGGFRSRELLPGQTAADRPDLVARVFNMKLDALLTDLWATGIFGHVLARVHTVRVPLDYL